MQLRVDVRQLRKLYGTALAVRDVSFDVGQSEFVSLLGPSGCGKTTTLRCIGGYERPSSGEILVDEERINDVPVHRRNIGMVFQSYALFPHKKVRDNVAFALKMQGVGKSERHRRAAEILELVHMSDLADRYPNQLSGGQRQRVALARAIIHRPKVLLLDEPLANLDRKLREAMRVELKLIQERVGISAVLVTHDQEEAMVISDRIVVMQDGEVHQFGTPTEVYNKPATRFVANFIGQTNFLDGTVTTVNGGIAKVRVSDSVEVEVETPNGCAPGSNIGVSVRPERIDLSSKRPAYGNVISGRVTFVTFVGSQAEYRVETDDGLVLEASEQVIDGLPHYREGEMVHLHWPADRGLAIV